MEGIVQVHAIPKKDVPCWLCTLDCYNPLETKLQ